MPERSCLIIAKRGFVYGAVKCRRGEVLVVSPAAADYLLSSKKAQRMKREECHRN